MNTNLRTALLGAALAPLLAPLAGAQISEYYVMAGDQATFHVIQGGVLLRSWSPAPGTANYQYPIAVTTTLRTMGANAGEIGAEYDLAGNDLTTRYTHPVGPGRCWDGATDGLSHYAIDSGGLVFRFDQSWSNPVQLFDAGSIGSVTYDPTNNSLWVGQFSTMIVTEYSLTGTVLRSFSTGHNSNMALAHDNADGTLWLHDRTTQGTFEQWSKAGALLARIAVAGMSGQNALGGEMPYRGYARCTFRNGNGVNPTGYDCVTRPALGTTWTTSYNTNPNTALTAILIGVNGPGSGIAIGNGELLLALGAPPIAFSGNGNLSLPVPNQPWLTGSLVSTQGLRIDIVGPLQELVLLNAQDVELGR